MSKRFQRWVETWIGENINPHSNVDIESNAARAERLTKKMLAGATAAGFSKFEIAEEQNNVPRLIQAAISDSTDFDIDAYQLKSLLAMENEDGD